MMKMSMVLMLIPAAIKTELAACALEILIVPPQIPSNICASTGRHNTKYNYSTIEMRCAELWLPTSYQW